jgi:hypothetical protein
MDTPLALHEGRLKEGGILLSVQSARLSAGEWVLYEIPVPHRRICEVRIIRNSPDLSRAELLALYIGAVFRSGPGLTMGIERNPNFYNSTRTRRCVSPLLSGRHS